MREVKLEAATNADFEWLLGRASATRALTIAPDLAPPDVLEIVRGLPANWLIIDGDEIVGIIGLKNDGGSEVEIGYGVAASHEGRGFASAAVARLLPVLKARGTFVINAETSVANTASQRILERNGFMRVGERNDKEDGPLIVWRLAL